MNRVREIIEGQGIEFDNMGFTKERISIKQFQKIYDSIIDANNASWQKSAIDNMNAPFAKMQEKLGEFSNSKKV